MMLETRKTSRFALIFFIFFIAVSFGIAFIPAFYSLSYAGQMLLDYFLVFFLPVCLYFAATKKNVRDTLRLNPLGWKNLLLIILMSFAVQPLISFFSFFSQLFFPNPVEASTDAIYSSNFFLMLLTIAILPAVFEETVMRGIIFSGYRAFGALKASLATALLFAMLHMNPQQFLYAFSMGFLFCIFVHRTNSIFSSVIPHFIVNATTVFSIFSAGTDSAANAPSPPMAVMFVAISVFALFALPVFAGLLYLFLKINPAPAAEPLPPTEPAEDAPPKARFFTLPILLVCLLYFLLGFLPYLLG